MFKDFLKRFILILIIIISNILLINCNYIKKENSKKKIQNINVAIIGANFAGCSVSYFLNKYFEKYQDIYKLNITIFDKNSKINENFPSKKILNTNVDLLSPYIYEWQTNMKRLIKDFSMELIKFNQSNSIGIYDGEEFLINESNKNFINKLKEIYPEDMNKMLTVLNKFHKSLQIILSNNDDNLIVKNLNDFMNSFKPNFADLNSLFFERTDVYMNNLDINFSFIDKIIRAFLYSNKLQGADNNAFSSLITILSQLNNKYYLKNGLNELAIKLLYDNPYYNVNTFIKYNTNIKKIEEKVVLDIEEGHKNKYYSLTGHNTKSDKIDITNSYDIVIISENCDLEIIDKDISEEKRNSLKISKNYKNAYKHVLLGNVDENYFSFLKNNDNNLSSEIEILEDLNNEYMRKENLNNILLPDLILINDNQNFNEFSQLQPICKNCYLNRFYDENKQKFNSVYKITSQKEKLSDDFLKKLFKGRVIYEDNKGFRIKTIIRKGLIVNDNINNIHNSNPDIEVCKKRIYNNLAFNFIDDNLEFSLFSSKNIAKMIFKNYVNEDADILSSDF